MRRTLRVVALVAAVVAGVAPADSQFWEGFGAAPARPRIPAKKRIPAHTPTPPAAEVGGTFLAAEEVDLARDRDTIKIEGKAAQFGAIGFRALQRDVFIEEVFVNYAGGSTERLLVNAPVRPAGPTSWVKLKGDAFIDTVQITYRPDQPRAAQGGKAKARVEVYGQPARDWLTTDGRGRQHNDGWVLLGAQIANRYFRKTADVIAVGHNEGGFSSLRIDVKERRLFVNELRVGYANREEQIIPIRLAVEMGSPLGPIEIKGDTARPIKDIRIAYRSAVADKRSSGKGGSIVYIWGRH